MAGITLEQAQAQLDKYLAAETAILSGQEYEIAGRRLRRANLSEVQQGISLWSGRVSQLQAKADGIGRSRVARPGW